MITVYNIKTLGVLGNRISCVTRMFSLSRSWIIILGCAVVMITAAAAFMYKSTVLLSVKILTPEII